MSQIFCCTLGKSSGYDSQTEYFASGVAVGSFAIPATAVAVHYRPKRTLCFCTPDVDDTFDLLTEEFCEHSLPPPEKFPVSVPHDHQGIDALLATLIDVLPGGADLHLEAAFGLRPLTLLMLLTADYLRHAKDIQLSRLTYVNFEAARETGRTEIVDLTPYLHLSRLAGAAASLERHGDLIGIAEAVEECYPGAIGGNAANDMRNTQDKLLLLRTRHIASKSTGMAVLEGIKRIFGERASVYPALSPLSSRVAATLDPIITSSAEGTLAPKALAGLAKWYLDHNQPALALLLIVEGSVVITNKIVLGNEQGNDGFESAQQILDDGYRRLIADGNRSAAESTAYLRDITRRERNTLAHAQLGETGARALDRAAIEESLAQFQALASRLLQNP